MPTPSLLIVPARFKTGKLYSQIPTSGAGDFTVTRATSATRVNASGLIESVASGIPRLDYFASGGTVGCPALLVEPSAQNLAINSQTWDASNNWQLAETSGRVTVATATSGTLAPDGTSTANAITPTSGNITHYLYSNASGSITYVSGTVYTISAFFKKGAGDSGRYVQVAGVGSRFLGNPFANFDLELGTALIVSGSVADSNRVSRIQNFGNGWYRCSLTATCNNSGVSSVGVLAALLTADTNARLGAAFAGNTSDYIFGWGAQLETGSVATSYIPTTAGTGSRSADAISVSSVSGLIGQTEGTVYFEYYHNTATNAGIRNAFNLEGNVGSQFNGINFATSNNGNDLQVAVQVSSSSVVSGGVFSTSVSEGWHKVAFGYNTAATGTVFYFDGNLIATRTLTSIPAMSRIALMARANPFSGFDLDRQFNNRIRAAALYTTRLTNAELAAITSP